MAYEPHYVNLLRDGGEQWLAAYQEVNPQSRVPTLVHDGRRITQSLAIIEYLEEVFREPPLLPSDPPGRARVRALAQIVVADIQPLQNTSTTRYLKEKLSLGDMEVNAWLREWIGRGLDAFAALLERDRPRGRFCHGEMPGLADCCLIPQLFAASRFGVDLARYPTLARIAEECQTLPAFVRAQPGAQADAS